MSFLTPHIDIETALSPYPRTQPELGIEDYEDQDCGCITPPSMRYGISAASQGARPKHKAWHKPKCGLQDSGN